MYGHAQVELKKFRFQSLRQLSVGFKGRGPYLLLSSPCLLPGWGTGRAIPDVSSTGRAKQLIRKAHQDLNHELWNPEGRNHHDVGICLCGRRAYPNFWMTLLSSCHQCFQLSRSTSAFQMTVFPGCSSKWKHWEVTETPDKRRLVTLCFALMMPRICRQCI